MQAQQTIKQNTPQNATQATQATNQAATKNLPQNAIQYQLNVNREEFKNALYNSVIKTIRTQRAAYYAALKVEQAQKLAALKAQIEATKKAQQAAQKAQIQRATQKPVLKGMQPQQAEKKSRSWGGLFRQIKLWFGKAQSSSQRQSSQSYYSIHQKNKVKREKDWQQSGKKQLQYQEQQPQQTTSLILEQPQQNYVDEKKNK